MSEQKIATGTGIALAYRFDRRSWIRYPSSRDGYCGLVAEGLDPQWRAEVQDVSAGGVALLVRRPFKVGARLVVRFISLAGEEDIFRQASIAHTRTCSQVGWIIGCAFYSPLSESEFQALWV